MPLDGVSLEGRYNFGSGGSIRMSGEEREDKWNVNPAHTQISPETGQNLTGLFFAEDNTGKLARIRGTSTYGNSSHEITNAQDMAKMAEKLGIPLNDVKGISFEENRGQVTSIGVTYNEGISPHAVAEHNGNIAASLEREGITPPGSTFKMSDDGLLEAPKPMMNTVVPGGDLAEERVSSVEFSHGNNSTGTSFSVKPSRSADRPRTSIAFGSDARLETETPGVHDHSRFVSKEDYARAQKLAQQIGGRVTGEAGMTRMGVTVEVDRPMSDVMTTLASKGVISSEVSGAVLDSGLLPQGHAPTTPVAPAATSPHVEAPHIEAPHIDAPHVKIPHASGASRIFGFAGTAAMAALVGGVTLATGGTKAQAAENAGGMVPVVNEGIALAEGKPVEAGMRTLEEIPVAGVALGAIARPIAQAVGADVDNSIVQDGLQAGRENRARQADLRGQIGDMNDKFHALRDSGFGMGRNKAERALGHSMHQIADQFIGGVGREDAIAKTRQTAQQTAQGLADYLETPGNDPEVARARQLVSSTLNETPEQYIKELREQAAKLAGPNSPAADAPSKTAVQPAAARAPASSRGLNTAMTMS